MELKNNIKVEIIKRGYKSVMHFCNEKELDYRKINRVVNQQNGGFYVNTIVEICDALNCDVGDLFYIEKSTEEV